jgi:ADP-ribose pyrophosphatase YjhB (NUDIX family)
MERIVKVGVLVVEKERALLIKEWSETRKDYYWNIVKGTYEEAIDKKFSDCAIREAKEEIGVTISLKGFMWTIVKYGHNIRVYFTFTASIVDGMPQTARKEEQLKRKENISDVGWLTKKELGDISKEDFLSDVAYLAVQKWIKNEVFPLELVEEIVLNS